MNLAWTSAASISSMFVFRLKPSTSLAWWSRALSQNIWKVEKALRDFLFKKADFFGKFMQIQHISSKPEKNTHPDKVHAWSELWHLNLFCFSGICHPWFIQGFISANHLNFWYPLSIPISTTISQNDAWAMRTDIGKSWKVWTFEVRLERWWLDWIINLVPIPRIGLVNKLDTLSKGNFLFQLSSNSLHRKEGTQKWMKFRFIVIENSNLINYGIVCKKQKHCFNI